MKFLVTTIIILLSTPLFSQCDVDYENITNGLMATANPETIFKNSDLQNGLQKVQLCMRHTVDTVKKKNYVELLLFNYTSGNKFLPIPRIMQIYFGSGTSSLELKATTSKNAFENGTDIYITYFLLKDFEVDILKNNGILFIHVWDNRLNRSADINDFYSKIIIEQLKCVGISN